MQIKGVRNIALTMEPPYRGEEAAHQLVLSFADGRTICLPVSGENAALLVRIETAMREPEAAPTADGQKP